LAALRSAGVQIAGVVLNRYNADQAGAAEETNAAAIERWGEVSVLCEVPEEPIKRSSIPVEIAAAIDLVNWAVLAGRRMMR